MHHWCSSSFFLLFFFNRRCCCFKVDHAFLFVYLLLLLQLMLHVVGVVVASAAAAPATTTPTPPTTTTTAAVAAVFSLFVVADVAVFVIVIQNTQYSILSARCQQRPTFWSRPSDPKGMERCFAKPPLPHARRQRRRQQLGGGLGRQPQDVQTSAHPLRRTHLHAGHTLRACLNRRLRQSGLGHHLRAGICSHVRSSLPALHRLLLVST